MNLDTLSLYCDVIRSGSFSLGAVYGLAARSRAICRTMDRSNGAGWALAGDKSPGATPDTNGNAEAARKPLRFTKQPRGY